MAPPKKVVRRPFLARRSGKAGGIGAALAQEEETPPKNKKSKSTGAHRGRAGIERLDTLNETYGYGKQTENVSLVETQYQNPFVGGGPRKSVNPPELDIGTIGYISGGNKQDHLDRQIKHYNQEQVKLNQQKQDLDR